MYSYYSPCYLESVLDRFPHYLTLHTLWKGVPSFDSETITSHPNVDHSGSFLETVQPARQASQVASTSATAEKALDMPVDALEDDDSEVAIVNEEPEGHWHQDRPPPEDAGFDIDLDDDHHDEGFGMDLDLPPAAIAVGASDAVRIDS